METASTPTFELIEEAKASLLSKAKASKKPRKTKPPKAPVA